MQKALLVILARRPEIAAMYHRDLEEIFRDSVYLLSVTLDDGTQTLADALSQADVLLVTDPENVDQVRHFIPESCQIILLQFSFSKEKIQPLKELPANTSALLCFQFYRVSLQSASILYENGIRHLLLDAYPVGTTLRQRHYDLAIVGDNSAAVPEGIPRVISLGKRKLSLTTLLSIANALNLWSQDIQGRMQAYCADSLVDMQVWLPVLQRIFWDQTQIKSLMNHVDGGVITCDPDYRVLDSNRNFRELLSVRQNIQGLPLQTIPALRGAADLLASDAPPNDLLIEGAARQKLLFSREDVPIPWSQDIYHMIFVGDKNNDRSPERSLQRQSLPKGHVTKYTFSCIVGKSPAICGCIERAERIAQVDKPTLLTGESGTGKELFAQSIHNASPRRDHPFLALNCAALPPSLLESELFGYTDGAFTGAKKGGHVGLFEQANGGTFFLDEIGELSPDLQAKLLRVLEEQEIMRVGSGEIIPINVRVISATHQNLRELAKTGKFRMDLYYRLNTMELPIPPLRDRKEDIPLLIRHFLEHEGLSHVIVSPEAMNFFLSFGWEGNVRELRNCIEYMAHICDGTITPADLPAYILQELRETQPPAALPDCHGESLSSVILNDADQKLAHALLSALSERCLSRVSLLELLRDEFPRLSDYHLRQLIERLQQAGLLRVNQGRRGMELTALGARWIGR